MKVEMNVKTFLRYTIISLVMYTFACGVKSHFKRFKNIRTIKTQRNVKSMFPCVFK